MHTINKQTILPQVNEAVLEEKAYKVLLAVPEPDLFRTFLTFKYWENKVMMENGKVTETHEQPLYYSFDKTNCAFNIA